MERIQQAGLKLNENKCVFGSTEVVFVGHLFSHEGAKPDPTKIEAIRDTPTPKSKQDLQRLLGMITYLGKFIPNLSIILRLQKYDMHIEFKPGKELTVADTLSRAFIPAKKQDEETEAEFQVHLMFPQNHGRRSALTYFISRTMTI